MYKIDETGFLIWLATLGVLILCWTYSYLH